MRPRHGVLFTGFAPAISPEPLKAISHEVRRWRLRTRTGLSLHELAERINSIMRGWMNCYGRFYRSQLSPLLKRTNAYLMRWTRKKYKRIRSFKRVDTWWFGLLDR